MRRLKTIGSKLVYPMQGHDDDKRRVNYDNVHNFDRSMSAIKTKTYFVVIDTQNAKDKYKKT